MCIRDRLYQLGFKPKDDFWATKDDDGPYIAWWTKRVEFPDDETLYAAAIEWGEKQKLIDCIYKRKQEYPTIEELVVALYDTEDKPAISAKRAAVKAKYPKPE